MTESLMPGVPSIAGHSDFGPLANFIIRCPDCGTSSDDPHKLFNVNGFAPVPNGDYVLWACICESCPSDFDVALWVGSIAVEHTERTVADPAKFFDFAVVERYNRAVKNFADSTVQEVLGDAGVITEDKGCVEADLSFLDEHNRDFQLRKPIIPAHALALARGTRMALGKSPSRMFFCQTGYLKFVITFDQVENVFHLSLSNQATRGPLTNPEVNFGISLFFNNRELAAMSLKPPERVVNSVYHCWIRTAC